MDYVVLVKDIVKDLTEDEFDVVSNDNNITITVSENDYGKVIGKGGATINAIRVLVDETATLHNDSFIKVEVEKKD